MRKISLLQPGKIVFGDGTAQQCVEDVLALGLRRIFIVTSSPILDLVAPIRDAFVDGGATVQVYSDVNSEPSDSLFERALVTARSVKPDAVIGIGGGSPMDVAKLVAALHDREQTIFDVFGIGLLEGRNTYLACMPTTSGTGSEVSPNAIFLHEADLLKKGVVSPHLVPDAAYVDPALTLTLPPSVTAATGVDALTHCIEAFANRYAHPIIDLFALQGIRLIAANLYTAVHNGDDVLARGAMSLGSLYGGLCLGPVNTGAVHALAYPLGGEFHVAHGVSNSVLLPHVLAFNLPAAPDRYAEIAIAMGVEPRATPTATAEAGIEQIRQLSRDVGIPSGMAELDVPEQAIPEMAAAAMKVTRLLRLNPREVTQADAEAIYRAAY